MKLEKIWVDQFTTPLCEMVNAPWLSSVFDSVVSIIILIDGLFFTPESIANFLQCLFTNKVFLANPVPILLAVNKSDSKRVIHNAVVYDEVERELGKIMCLEDFSFKSYSPCTIYACNCSILSNSFSSVVEFMHCSF